jgi:CheY-like chemotaxis protein
LTAFARDSDREAAVNAGFQEHVPKPVDGEKLVAVMLEVAPGKG